MTQHETTPAESAQNPSAQNPSAQKQSAQNSSAQSQSPQNPSAQVGSVDWTGRVLQLRVEGPAHGGEFVARHDGRVVFLRGGITDELVEVEIEDDPGRGFCRGTVRTVCEASPDRVEPTCPAAAAGAGCCDWSHIAPAAARRFSGRVLAEQAARIGRIDLPGTPVPVDPPAGDTATTGWRTIARWVTDADGRPGVRRTRSREVITEPCSQPDPRLLEAVLAADLAPGREVLAVLGDTGSVHVAHRAASDDAPRGRGRKAARSAATRARARQGRGRDWEYVAGRDTVVRRVGERTWTVPVDSFWQAHRSAATHYSALVGAAVVSAPGLSRDPVVWDLYGGAGVFAAAVRDAVPGARVSVVESAAGSLAAAASGLGTGEGIRTVRSRVDAFLGAQDIDDHASAPEVVVLDPPRGGAGIPVMEALAGLTRSRIVHVGCDPASLARDVGALVSAGWTLREFHGVAAFPGTHHVEGVAVLDAPGRD